ncbi:Molybdopterin synthase catalytic subunit-like protein [Hapsidospora chrysogenum ATCC 11550]|uniref:Molybdopterin synthase catalytic subunit n=1 Tax=Hapsidospora chrysogenum (strain ATCC 11550 / CBS 779.69 / DSM 880 / IAM 14645 / JCM 23072 / IMI 49137) TaxID=857340 RepID=A0A086T012_HAPC1|nr:Molybdopterin synthase catalytic subunit-like protein [Hapsidospora chrysogenum ATCC 11550]
MTDTKEQLWELSEDNCHVALTSNHLNVQQVMDRVRSPAAGAIVLFAGTTRDNFAGKPVKELQYTAYNPLALRTMLTIARTASAAHSLQGVCVVHRLGTVPIGEESILIAVSAPHRQAAWRAGEEVLEECKRRVEVWKREEFEGEGGVWRANRDGAVGEMVTTDG